MEGIDNSYTIEKIADFKDPEVKQMFREKLVSKRAILVEKFINIDKVPLENVPLKHRADVRERAKQDISDAVLQIDFWLYV